MNDVEQTARENRVQPVARDSLTGLVYNNLRQALMEGRFWPGHRFKIRELAATGTAVIVVSSELPELIGMSDRILIMHEGSISGEVPAQGADDELLLSYAYGRSQTHD